MNKTTTHITEVVSAESTSWHGNESYTIICTCGERVTYFGKEFTEVEAMRHRKHHTMQALTKAGN